MLWIALLAAGCGSGSDVRENAVARVYDEYLMRADLHGIVPEGMSSADSALMVRDYINNWIQNKLLLHQAEENLSNDQKDFTRKMEEYRNSLIIYAYEQELIRQKVDTVVNPSEIVQYYNTHNEDFELRDNIVKVIYVKLQKGKQVDRFRPLIRSEKDADRVKLQDLSDKFAINSYLDEDNWLLFNDILKEIPIKTYNQEEYLKNNRFIELEDSLYTYLLNIKGFMIKESVSPLSFETENIRSIIISKRKMALIEDMQKNLYNDALKQGDFEILEK